MKRTPLRRISRKRARQLAERAHVRQTVLERDVCCRGLAVLPEIICSGPLDVHEIVRRSQDSSAWLNPDLCLLICRAHHRWLHDNPADAVRLGWLLHAEQRSALADTETE